MSARLTRLAAAIATTLVAALALALPVAAPASAYTSDGGAEVSDTTPAPGAPVTVSGSGFGAGTTVTVVMYSTPVELGTAVADAAGQVSLGVTIPSSVAPGSSHRIELQGVDADGNPRTVTQAITIAGGSSSGGASLAQTGATLIPILVGASLLVVVGGLLVATGRLRRPARQQ